MLTPFEKAAHLWRRAGFGASTRQVHDSVEAGLDATLDRLLDFEREDPDLEAELDNICADLFDLNNNPEDLRSWWMYRMVNTSNPLREKLTLFWHGHFATSQAKVERTSAMLEQNQTLRRLAGATFREILDAISKDPAMLTYLDGNSNRKGKPNENYARELFELFTLGIGNYTEKDVQESARAFTGWGTAEGQFRFDAKQHDAGVKRVLDRDGALDGRDVLDSVAAHPATSMFLAWKLCRYFVNDDPNPNYVARVAAAYRRSGGHMRAVVEAVFRDPEFFHEENTRAVVKGPAEYTVSCLKTLDVRVPIRTMAGPTRRMGQILFAPASVKGWDGGAAWLTSASIFERANFALTVTSTRGLAGEHRFDPKTWMQGKKLTTVEEVVDALAWDLLHTAPSAETRTAVVEYLRPEKPVETAGVKEDRPMVDKAMKSEMQAQAGAMAGVPLDLKNADVKIRGAARLLLSSPEFQLS